MTDKALLQECYDQLRIMFNPDVPLMQKLTARLAQPEPEPVGWIYEDDEGRMMFSQMPQNSPLWEPVYLTKKQWKGLTDEEIKAAWSQLWCDLGNGKFAASDDPSRHTTMMFARAIEAKLKEKNHD